MVLISPVHHVLMYVLCCILVCLTGALCTGKHCLLTSTLLCISVVGAGMLTFWLSRGRGGSGLGQTNGSTLYALVSTGKESHHRLKWLCC